jgi:hypothetical protein
MQVRSFALLPGVDPQGNGRFPPSAVSGLSVSTYVLHRLGLVSSQEIPDLRRVPVFTCYGAVAFGIQAICDVLIRQMLGTEDLDVPADQTVGLNRPLLPHFRTALPGFRCQILRISQDHAPCFGSCQGFFRPGRDHPGLLLGDCGEDMNRQRVDFGEIDRCEPDAAFHQA